MGEKAPLKTILVGFCSMALFLGLSLLRFELELPQGGRPLWQGYQVLLIGEENLVEAHQLLEDRGYRVLSLRNQRVSIYDYDGWQNFLLTAMSSEMDPLDPRIDPCLSQLSGYFYAWKRGDDGKEARWSILYVETPDSPGLLDRKIEHLFSEDGIDYALPEGEGMRKDVLWLLGGMFFFSLALLLRKNWWQIFFIFLPWGASIISGRPEVVFSNNLAALSLIFIHKKLHFIRQFQLDYPLAGRARVFRLFSSAWPGFLLFGASLVLLILTHDRGGLTGILIGALAHLGWMGSESAFHEWRRLRRIHRLYHPLLLADNLDLRQLPKKRAIFLGLVLLSMPLLSLFAGGAGGDWRLPSPEFRDGTLSWENLESLWEADSPGDLPNLADFLAHRAYQEGFFYGGSYDFPRPEGSLKSTKYTPGTSGIEETEVLLLEFTNSWYVSILKALDWGGVFSLLLRQDAPAHVAMKVHSFAKPAMEWILCGITLSLFCGFYLSLSSFFWKKRRRASLMRRPIPGQGGRGVGKLLRYGERTGAA